MEYGKIIKDALNIAWRQRCLWVFGFFAGAGIPNMDYKVVADKLDGLWDWLTMHSGLALILTAIALFVAVAFWVLQIISQASLVKGVGDMAIKGATTFDSSLNHGIKYFWKVFLLQLLMVAAFLVFIAAIGAPPILMVIFGGTAFKVLGVVWLIAAVLPAIAVLATIGLMVNFSLRLLVLEGKTVRDSLKSSWTLIVNNLSESAILFAIGLGIGLAVGIALFLTMIVLAIPFIVIGLINLTLGLVSGLVVGLVLFVLAVCILGVFQSAFWTLGFLRLPSKANLSLETAAI